MKIPAPAQALEDPQVRKMDSKIAFLNFRSLKRKKRQKKFTDTLKAVDADVFGIVETWLDDDIITGNDPHHPEYTIVSKCSRIGKAGGVAVFARNNLVVENINEGLPEKHANVQYCKIKYGGRFLVFIYRAPRATEAETDVMFDFIKKEARTSIIMGDLNLNTVDWHLMKWPPKMNSRMDKIIESNLHQIVEKPTRKKNILDIILTTDPSVIEEVEVIDEKIQTGGSDHSLIKFSLKIISPVREKKTIIVDDYKNADMNKYREILTGMLIAKRNVEVNNLDEKCESITNDLKVAWGIAVPKKEVNIGGRAFNLESTPTASIGKQLRRLCRKRQKLSHQSLHLDLEIKSMSQLYRKLRRRDHRKEEHRIFNGDLTGKVHIASHIKKFNKSSDRKPGPLKVDGKTIHDDLEIANAFKDTICSNFTRLEIPNLDQPYPPGVPKMQEINFTCRMIKKEIRTLKRRTAFGLDGISASMLLESRGIMIERLRDLFQHSYNIGRIPMLWTCSSISPIYKKGKRDDPKNYRPIAIASNLLKIMEKCIMTCVNRHLKKYGLWCDHQHAYRSQRSTAGNLIDHCHRLQNLVGNRQTVTCFHMDASSAFEMISFTNIIRGLFAVGMPGGLIEWFKSLLLNRQIRVKIGNTLSEPGVPSSGSGQGDPTSAYLFTLAINDAGSVIPEEYKDIAFYKLYSDDELIMVNTTTVRGITAAKTILANYEKWCKERTIFINPKKCMKITYGPPMPDVEYKLNEEIIQSASLVKDLGVYFQENLRFDYHIDKMIRTIRSIVFKLRKIIITTDVRVRSHLWMQFCLPNLTYCAQVYGRPKPHQLAKLQNLQKLFFSGSQPCTSCREQKLKRKNGIFEECVSHIGSEPVDITYLKLDLKAAHSILTGHMEVTEEIFRKPLNISNTRLSDSGGLLYPVKTKIEQKNTFAWRATDLWLKLSPEMQNPTLKKFQFAKKLDKDVDFLNWNPNGTFNHKQWDRSVQKNRLQKLEYGRHKIKFHL